MHTHVVVHPPSEAPQSGGLPPVLPLPLGVVSIREGLGQTLQARLDQIAPGLYQISQVETRAALEQALWVGATAQHGPVACLIDTACPAMQDVPPGYFAWLARLTRPIALLEEALYEGELVRDLCAYGFLAALPLSVSGWSLYMVLAQHLQQPQTPADQTGAERSQSVRCSTCQVQVPATARYCGDCGAPLPAPRPTTLLERNGGR